jgi:hypothetical protein
MRWRHSLIDLLERGGAARVAVLDPDGVPRGVVV